MNAVRRLLEWLAAPFRPRQRVDDHLRVLWLLIDLEQFAPARQVLAKLEIMGAPEAELERARALIHFMEG